ncbi:MAG: class I SAM-dependent methyltransferase [Oscillatoriales cyanobacterium]|nr:MAG: class I SAM-dependent methyltransferase [Oscillatoriales cyanobacterium]TAD98178.1 MAG: class I SAM-dependent methyltransferase [Oscillatoriales cyanobacterium]TAE06576.1 MAG: class I SAM-dependent methyltransferase [Oscillatoriales cyanobacterium]TAF06138.1 MAG: class I SAM-dependent methyltransferase [Oscillatoriales cyanobacterium]TAF47657.1 MAG: class I SAM-dependent methyltransferase [Oscillatoriales cyanobacterium]
MTVEVKTNPGLASRLVNGVLSIKPLANIAKHQAREMMIKRAEKIGVHWRQDAQALLARNWDAELLSVQNPNLVYPKYYLTSFHAYEKGNMSWEAATEVEVAARAVHAGIWPEAGAEGDAKLRESYHQIIQSQISQTPQDIVDLGCSVGMSTFAMQDVYPEANTVGVDLSPYFLAVAQYRSQQKKAELPNQKTPTWVHAAAESTGLPGNGFDLVSIFLVCHELPQKATMEIFLEARRLLRDGGHLTIMDMNPKSEIYAKMPPYILTLLKSTEPYLDQYFGLDIEQALVDCGFAAPTITCNTPRHRTIVAEAINSQV